MNEDLFQSVYKELIDKAQLRSLNEVSSSYRSLSFTLLTFFVSLSPFMPHSSYSCTLHHAPCTTHHTICTTHHAPCLTHHAPCPMHHLSFPLLSCLPALSCGWFRVASSHRKVVRTSHVPLGSVVIVTETSSLTGTPVVAVGTTTPPAHAPPLDVLDVPRPHPMPSPGARFFHRAQPSKASLSVPYVWPWIPSTPGSVAPRPSGTDPRPGAERARKGDLSPQLAPPCAATGTTVGVAPPAHTSSATSVPDAETKIMALRNVLERRKNQALTPYKVEAWESCLHLYNLFVKYPTFTQSLRTGFNAGIQPIYITSTPANSSTLCQHPEAYQEMVAKEFKKGRYIGPCTHQEVEALIGPFQSSPLSWVPKPGKPGKYRAVHNFSYPHVPTLVTTSINHTINANMFPCTWGTFATTCFTIFNLPPGSQAAIRDVAEAYCTIPITSDQWPGLMVKFT